MATLCQFYVKICIFQHGFYPPPQPPPFFCPFGISGHIGYHMFFWGSEPNSKVFLIFIEGFPIPSHVWEYPKYQVIPKTQGLPKILGITWNIRYYPIFQINPKVPLLCDVLVKPVGSGITQYFGYSQTWLGISGITPQHSWVVVGGSFENILKC